MIIKIGLDIFPSLITSTFFKMRKCLKKRICDKNRVQEKICPLSKPETTGTSLACAAACAYDIFGNIRRKTNIGAITRARKKVSLNLYQSRWL